MATQPTPFAHFATWPPKLVETMVKAGTSEHGACPTCGKAWERVVERTGETTTEKRKRLDYSEKRGNGGALIRQNLDYSGGHGDNARPSVTTGWRPACTCREYRLRPDLSEQEREYVMRRLGVPEPVV